MTHPPEGAPERTLTEDRRKHVDLIQAAVGRMASASSTAKSWLLPVATATYGYALTKNADSVAVLGMAAVLLFAFLDSHYLRQERAFRALYRAAINQRVASYEMNNFVYYGKPNGDEADEREENCRWRKVVWSWSIAGFYLPILATGAIVAFRASGLLR